MELINKDNFEEKVASGVTLVDFFGETCEPCKALMPHVEKLEETYGDKVPFLKLDTGGARRLAIKLRVMGLPTVAIFKDGEKVEELAGAEACTPEAIEEMVKKYI